MSSKVDAKLIRNEFNQSLINTIIYDVRPLNIQFLDMHMNYT